LSNQDYKWWQTYLKILTGTKQESSVRASLIRDTSGTFLVKAANIVLLLLSALLLARLMGAQDYGAYAYILSWVSILLIPALFGMDTLLVRQIAIYDTHSQWALMKGIMGFSVYAVLTSSASLALIVALIAYLKPSWIGTEHITTFWTSLILLPLMALLNIQSGVMRGLHAVIRAQLPLIIIHPVVLIVSVIVVHYLFKISITPLIAVILTIACTVIALIISTMWELHVIPAQSKDVVSARQFGNWLRSALPLVFMAGMGEINKRTDILMIGSMLDYQSAGIYAVAGQLSNLVAFILIVVNTVLTPVFARLHSTGNKNLLQTLITKSTRFMIIVAIPVAFILAIFGNWILFYLGGEFTSGLSALRILILGQIVNVAAGSVGGLLIMTGYERDAALGTSIAAIINIGLNFVLIPIWGIAGAAVATAISLTLWNVILALFVFTRLGIYSFGLYVSKSAGTRQ